MLHAVNEFITWFDGLVWGLPLIILILATGIYLTFRLKLLQCRHLGKALKFMVKNEEDGHGEVTSFGALCTALSATIGTGNIVGVATAIAAAAAQTREPVRQGLVTMTGTFIDTIVICTMTGLSIVLAGSWNTGLEGVQITMDAFQKGLPFPPAVASFVLMICLVFFAFTTILGWNYYGERCLEYLSNRNQKAVKAYRWLYILAVFIGPYMTVEAVWNIADIFNALMAIPNLIAIIALRDVIAKETQAFFDKVQ